MKQSSLIYYAILMYIFMILGLYLCKPDFIYDNKKNSFKEFGFENNKTPFSLPIIAIILAIIIYMLFSQFVDKSEKIINHPQNFQYMIPNMMPNMLPYMMQQPPYNPNMIYYTNGIQPQIT